MDRWDAGQSIRQIARELGKDVARVRNLIIYYDGAAEHRNERGAMAACSAALLSAIQLAEMVLKGARHDGAGPQTRRAAAVHCRLSGRKRRRFAQRARVRAWHRVRPCQSSTSCCADWKSARAIRRLPQRQRAIDGGWSQSRFPWLAACRCSRVPLRLFQLPAFQWGASVMAQSIAEKYRRHREVMELALQLRRATPKVSRGDHGAARRARPVARDQPAPCRPDARLRRADGRSGNGSGTGAAGLEARRSGMNLRPAPFALTPATVAALIGDAPGHDLPGNPHRDPVLPVRLVDRQRRSEDPRLARADDVGGAS